MSVDPTQTLAEIRELANEWPEIDDFDALPKAVLELDEWLSKGGFLPQQWSNLGRPRKTEFGPKLEDPKLTHGKASTYAKGCRCEDCTEANRIKAARWRQTQKERAHG